MDEHEDDDFDGKGTKKQEKCKRKNIKNGAETPFFN
jgi:hypothetical protein